MEIPSKIFITRSTANILASQDNTLASIWSKPSCSNDLKETLVYTNLSDVWHDVEVEKQPQKVCGNNPVLVVGLRKGRISYKYLWTDMEDSWEDLKLLTPLVEKKLYDKVLWAYLKDVVPFLNNEQL